MWAHRVRSRLHMGSSKMESVESEAAPSEITDARLLVVDDNEANLDMLSRRLERRGYEVDTAKSGPEALEALAARVYDAVLLDIMMPGMSGLEVLQRLRRRFAKTELPVLMATAKSSSRDVVEALRLGANDYVTKPLDFPMVMARLEGQVAIRREMLAHRHKRVLIGESDGLPVGAILDGRYEIVGRLGEGGFAVVYKASQLSTGQAVAVKILRSTRLFAKHEGAEAELRRFQREVQVIAEVKHPALVRLIDSGSLEVEAPGDDGGRVRAREIAETIETSLLSDHAGSEAPDQFAAPTLDVPYLVMEFLDGETLAQRLLRGALSAAEALTLLFPILGGVHAMHQHGVVHRDLKPSNVFLREREGRIEPTLVDFGIAKLMGNAAQSLTADSSFLGTPRYMSPEQSVGADDVGPASDQYSLAVMLYESLSGEGPYDSRGYAHLILKVSEADCVPLSERCQLDSALAAVVHKGLAKESVDRHVDLLTFGRALLPFAPPELRSRWRPYFT